MDIQIHGRVFRRHPNLSEEDIRFAWEHSYFEALRPDSPNFPEYVWVGFDASGREIEMVGVLTTTGYLIYHANTPVSNRIKRGMRQQRKGWR